MIILFTVAMIWFVVKVLCLGIRLMWNISKFFVGLILFPAILVFLFVTGVVYLALPLLLIAGVVVLIAGASKNGTAEAV